MEFKFEPLDADNSGIADELRDALKTASDALVDVENGERKQGNIDVTIKLRLTPSAKGCVVAASH